MGLRSHGTCGNDSRRRLKEFSRARVVTPGQGAAGLSWAASPWCSLCMSTDLVYMEGAKDFAFSGRGEMGI